MNKCHRLNAAWVAIFVAIFLLEEVVLGVSLLTYTFGSKKFTPPFCLPPSPWDLKKIGDIIGLETVPPA